MVKSCPWIAANTWRDDMDWTPSGRSAPKDAQVGPVKPLNPPNCVQPGAYRRWGMSIAGNICVLAAMFLMAPSVFAEEIPPSVSSAIWKIYYATTEEYSATAVAIGGDDSLQMLIFSLS